MPISDQIVHAFFSDEKDRLAKLIENQDLAQATAEQLFLIGWSCDSLGVNQPERMRACFEQLRSRFPATPFAIRSQAVLERMPPRNYSKNEK